MAHQILIRKLGPNGKGWIARSFEEVKETFLGLITKLPNGCWQYPSVSDADYGRVFFDGKRIKAHRFAWIVFKGKIPTGKQVLHHCDFRPCVNPDHLFLGVHGDNMRDMAEKGRAASFPLEKNPNSKYNRLEVAAVRTLSFEKRLNSTEIERITGIPRSTVRNMVNRRSWRV